VWFSLKEEPHGDGAWLDETGMLRLRVGALQGRPAIDDAVCHRRELKLMGAHNIANVLAASAVSACAGASLDAIRGTAIAFTGVAHRLQLVAERNGVRYYDDSIATAPERMMAALRCFEQKVILLCGGRDKHLPWDEAAALMYERCKAVLLFGEMGPMVAEHVSAVTKAAGSGLHVETCAALEDAVTRASTLAIHGDIVLLSPGGTSYDAFKDFAERGDRFSALAAAA
jgi:UDP-N-acetylmuramoylalanine--D-glutamate ligase